MVKEKISESLDKKANPTKDTLQKMKVVITTDGQLPANKYLTTILRTFEREAALLGLDATTKLTETNRDGTNCCEPLSDEERVAALARLDAAVGTRDRSETLAGRGGLH